MRVRWPRYLPRFPAVLLVPAILGLWLSLCTVPREHSLPWLRYTPGHEFPHEFGVPFAFDGVLRELEPGQSYHAGFQFGPFIIDLALALAVAWGLSMAADRLLLQRVGGTQLPWGSDAEDPS